MHVLHGGALPKEPLRQNLGSRGERRGKAQTGVAARMPWHSVPTVCMHLHARKYAAISHPRHLISQACERRFTSTLKRWALAMLQAHPLDVSELATSSRLRACPMRQPRPIPAMHVAGAPLPPAGAQRRRSSAATLALARPPSQVTAAVVTTGSICPGMNDGGRHQLTHGPGYVSACMWSIWVAARIHIHMRMVVTRAACRPARSCDVHRAAPGRVRRTRRPGAYAN